MWSEFPAVVFKLKSLCRLYAQHLLLNNLPEEIGGLTNLQVLALNGNCFTTLPDSLAHLQKLTSLSLNGVVWAKVRIFILKKYTNAVNIHNAHGNCTRFLPFIRLFAHVWFLCNIYRNTRQMVQYINCTNCNCTNLGPFKAAYCPFAQFSPFALFTPFA